MIGFGLLAPDERDAAALTDMIRNRLDFFCAEVELCVYGAAEALLADRENHDFRMLFLDADAGGIPAAKEFRRSDTNCGVVFFSASGRKALESYGAHPIAYLVKPFRSDLVFEAMDWCASWWRDALRCIGVVAKRMTVKIALRDIEYIEVAGRTCVIHRKSGNIAVNRSLSSLEQELGGRPFVRCHKSYTVNLYQVGRFGGDCLLTRSGARVPVSAEYARDLRFPAEE